MKKKLTLIIFGLMLIPTVYAAPADSVGLKVKQGKIYIMHEVEKGQGLFTISRKYNVALTDIVGANPGSDKQINVGQILLIPTGKDAPMEEKVVKDYFSEGKPQNKTPNPANRSDKEKKTPTTFAAYHLVGEGETLYAISRKYNTTVEVIRDLNNLEDDVLSLGQKLMVPNAGASKTTESVKDKKAEKLGAKGKKESMLNDGKEESGAGIYVKTVEIISEFDIEKVKEKGFATLLNEDEARLDKNYCFHHEAEEGTVIMVTNPSTQKSVFVKVVGKLSFNEEEAVVIRITPAAAKSIGMDQDHQRVEINYAR